MINLRTTAVAMCFALVAWPGAATDRLQLVSLQDEMLPEPRVTADAVFVGLVWPGLQDTAATSGAILAAIPQEMRAQDVCVRVATEDGRYNGRARYRDTGLSTSEMIVLPYVSSESDLATYSDPAVAVLAFTCDGSTGVSEIAVTSWRSAAASGLGDTANLLVNSFRADAAFVLIDGASEVECVRLSGGERAAFDFSCALNIADIQSGAHVALFRERGGSLDPEVAIDIVGWK